MTNRENSESYIKNIDSILSQDLEDKHIVFSGCCISAETFSKIYGKFQKKISYYLTNERLAVNQTFNHAVLKSVEGAGEYDGYMYVASDVNFSDDKSSLRRLHDRILNPENGIVSPEIDKDNGYFWWFGFDEKQNIWDVFGKEKDFVVPVGSTANLHCSIFSNKIFKAYGRIIPDIFVSYCTESTFSFLSAAVGQRFIIANDVKYSHGHDQGTHSGLDGQTQAFGAGWDRVYPGSKSIKEIVEDPAARACGFGHEEWVPRFIHKMDVPDDKTFLMHDEKQFDEKGFSIDGRLEDFIKNNLFASKNVLNYDTIRCKFIENI